MEYSEVIDFSKLKKCIEAKRTTNKYLAQDIGVLPNQISQIINGSTIPVTSTVAKIAWVLKVPVSEIVEFKNLKENKFFTWEKPLYEVPDEPVGEVTYKPLWNLLEDYLKDKPGKTANNLFDQIEPYRRRTGSNTESIKKALEARGITGDYEATRKRTAKGLPELTRAKLRNDRSLSLRTIYDICNFLGCQPDFIMSYK